VFQAEGIQSTKAFNTEDVVFADNWKNCNMVVAILLENKKEGSTVKNLDFILRTLSCHRRVSRQ
jgi:hypothetical protein